jgi:hypothetical protein
MAEYTVVAPDGKEIVLEGPAGASQADVIAQAQKLYKLQSATGGTNISSDVPSVITAQNRGSQMPTEPQSSMMDKLKALYEVPAAIGSGMIAQPVGAAYGALRGMTSPQYGTQQGIAQARQAGGELAQRLQYQPTSPVSQDVLQNISGAVESAKLPPYMGNIGAIPSAIQAGNVARPAINQTMQTAKPAVNTMAQTLRKEAPTMSGVGAAELPEAVVRAQMAEQLRVPIKLSKGQATRELGQQQFEAETMKTYPEDVGRPLILAQELRNAQIGQNLDAYVDATGAKVANEFYFRPTGEAVDTALRESATAGRKAYKNAYDVARASEEGQQKVNVQNIISQLDDMEPEASNAPVITAAKMKLEKLSKNGEMTLNAIEEVRKMVNRLSKDSPSNMEFGGDIKKMIDTATENAGGDLFKEARKLRTKFANEFENIGLIDDLLSNKPNSKDRVVAMEKVFDKSVMQSDLDSLKALGYSLKKTEKGQQAWAEIKGQTLSYLRDSITKGIQTDSLGQRTFNPKQFDIIVKNLDKSGKLDYLFSKSGAQEIRNLRDTVININSTASGINTSNTSSAVNKVLDSVLKKVAAKLPIGGPMIEAGAEAVEKKNIAKKVEKSLEFKAKDMANELRKGK